MKAHTLTPRSGMLTWLTRTVFRFLALASVALAPAMSLSCTNQKDVRAGLQDAVDRALPGGTIELGSGEIILRKRLVINKSLTIRGAGPDKTRIISWEPDVAIAFVGDNEWRLEDLSVEHLGSEPAHVIRVRGGAITIRNCHFSGAVGDKETRNGGCAICLTGSARVAVINCVCRNNGAHGIQVSDQAQALLEGNTCEGNKYSGIAYFGSAGGTARNNTCRNNGLHGIQVSDQAQPTLEGNTCEGNKGLGIMYFDSAGGTARNNTCRKNGYHGIQVSRQAQPILERNTCEGNNELGIAYWGSAGGTARNNTCRNNGYHGIGVQGQAQPTLEGNTCEGNTQSGIAYFESAGGIARNNICRNNGDNGIYVKKGAKPQLEGNILQGNRGGDLNVE